MLSVLIALAAGSALGAALYFTTSLHPAISAITALAGFTLIYVLILKQVEGCWRCHGGGAERHHGQSSGSGGS